MMPLDKCQIESILEMWRELECAFSKTQMFVSSVLFFSVAYQISILRELIYLEFM